MLHLLPATASCTNLVEKNQFPGFAVNFNVWSHVLSTGGDALRTVKRFLWKSKLTSTLKENCAI